MLIHIEKGNIVHVLMAYLDVSSIVTREPEALYAGLLYGRSGRQHRPEGLNIGFVSRGWQLDIDHASRFEACILMNHKAELPLHDNRSHQEEHGNDKLHDYKALTEIVLP